MLQLENENVSGTFRFISFAENSGRQETCLQAMRNFIDTLQALTRIKTESDLRIVRNCFKGVFNNLPGPITVQKLTGVDEKVMNDELIEAFSQLLNTVLRVLTPHWNVFKTEVTNIFVVEESFALSSEILSTLCGYLKIEGNIETLGALACILLKYIKSDVVLTAIVDCSSISFEDANEKYKYQAEWETYVQTLATLPERVANRLEMETPKDFAHETYSYYLIFQIVRSIDFMAECHFQQGTRFDLSYLAHFISKVITNYNMNGNSRAILTLVDILICWTDEDDKKSKFVKRKLIQSTLKQLSRQSIECISIMFLNRCPIDYRKDSQTILNVLGRNFDESKDWSEILTYKIPFYFKPKGYKDTTIPENLIYYISTSKNKENLTDLIIRLARVWSTVKVTSTSNVVQHIYMSQLLVLGIKYRTVLAIKNKIEWPLGDIKNMLFRGMSKHLDICFQEFRCIGMATIEISLKNLAELDTKDKEVTKGLNFEYADMGENSVEIHRIFKSLTQRCLIDKRKKLPKNYTVKKFNIKEALDSIADKIQDYQSKPVHNTVVTCAVRSTQSKQEILKTIISNKIDLLQRPVTDKLDSDDDLEPYDMSNDVPVAARMKPRYLRDMINDIVEAKDAETFEACMSVSEDLVTRQLKLEGAKLITELLDLFVHLEEKYHVDNFDNIKFNTVVAIVCSQPIVSAEHLCKELHTDVGRYSIATKIFMLDVISEAVNRIADVRPSKKAEKEIISKEQSGEIPAEEVIRRRLINKTRYFHSIRPHPFAKAKKNEFSAIADSFFYPLIGGFGYKQLSLSRHNTKQDVDNILLYKYLSVIGNVILASKNCVKCPQYCWEILQMVQYLRYSPDQRIQFSVISIIASVVLALPACLLRIEFFGIMLEIRAWLFECLRNIDLVLNMDSQKTELGVFAGQVLGLIDKALQEPTS